MVKSPNVGRVLGSITASTTEPKTNNNTTAPRICAGDKGFLISSFSFFKDKLRVTKNFENLRLRKIASGKFRTVTAELSKVGLNALAQVLSPETVPIELLPSFCTQNGGVCPPRTRFWNELENGVIPA